MSLINSFENDLLLLLFNNTTIANVGDAGGLLKSVGDGDMFISLHTADPGETAADQDASQTTYTGYARQAAPRTSGGWTVSGTAPTVAENAALEQFGENSGGSVTITDFGLGFAVSGAGKLYMIGAAALVVSTGVNPQFAINALDVELA